MALYAHYVHDTVTGSAIFVSGDSYARLTLVAERVAMFANITTSYTYATTRHEMDATLLFSFVAYYHSRQQARGPHWRPHL